MTGCKSGLKISSIGLVVAAICLVTTVTGCANDADRAYVNGTIYTVDDDFSTATALAIRDGKFIYVGDEAGAQPHLE